MDAQDAIASLAPDWRTLDPAAQRALAASWVDTCVRADVAAHLERLGEAAVAAQLRNLAPIVDEATMLRAEVLLSRLTKHPSAEVQRASYGLLRHFELLKGELALDEAAYLLLETRARLRPGR